MFPEVVAAAGSACRVVVLPGDWGVVTLEMTRQYGVTFASLNMANAYGPGGGYTVLLSTPAPLGLRLGGLRVTLAPDINSHMLHVL